MTEKELRKLSRLELVQLLILSQQRNHALAEENEELKKKLDQREIICKESGNIAKAALELNGIFEAAQKACDDYLRNVQNAHEKPVGVSQNEASQTDSFANK